METPSGSRAGKRRAQIAASSALILIACAAVMVIALAAVASTHRIFSQVIDEPAHIAAGYNAVTARNFQYDPAHPPLARILFALPLRHLPDPGLYAVARGNALLGSGREYVRRLAAARRGNLLFLLVGAAAVAAWARQALGPTGSLVALALFVTAPPVLAHAGLATTDMAAAATVPLALFALAMFLHAPSMPRAVMLGLCAGIGTATKFSFPVYFAVGAVIVMATTRRWRLPIRYLAAALVTAFVVVWAAYGFTFSTLAAAHPQGVLFVNYFSHGHLTWLAERIPVPAPMFFVGGMQLALLNVGGHTAILFGQKSMHGWWYYFPLMLLLKTPIPLLALCAIGAVRGGRMFALLALAMLAVVLPASVNVGVRHVLPLYGPMCIAAAAGFGELRNRLVPGVAAIALIVWQVVSTAAAWPDFIPWYNAFAGRHPESIASDSNFDWGQDLSRLARFCRQHHIDHLRAQLFTSADLSALGLPRVEPLDRSSEAMAISESVWQHDRADNPAAFSWLDARPMFRIGKTIRFYPAVRVKPGP